MGIRERQDRERQAVTTSILDAARDLFVNEGYRNVSIRKIAERIEYSPAAIYSYFGSKDDIFYALAEEGFRRLDEQIIEAVGAHTDDPMADIRRGWWGFYLFSKEQPEFFSLMFVDRSVPKITEQWEGFEILQAMLGRAVAALQRATGAGHFPKAMNPHVAMHVLWGALVGPSVIGNCNRLGPNEDRDALARDVLETTLAGLQAGVTLTFVPGECAEDHAAAATVGVRNHESS